MSAPAPPKPKAPGLPDDAFPQGDPPGDDTEIYGNDVVAAAEQENLAQAALMAAAMVEIVELFPLLDFDDLGSSGPWLNRNTEVVMRYRDKAFDRAVVDFDRYRAIRLGEQAAPRSSLGATAPSTPSRRASPARIPGALAPGASNALPNKGGQAQLPGSLPPGLVAELRRQERRRRPETPKVDLDSLAPDKRAAAGSIVVRPGKLGNVDPQVRRVLTGAGPANVKHRTLGLANKPTFPTNRDRWFAEAKSNVLVEVMGAAVRQIADGQRDATDQMRAADRAALGYQRVVRGATPCAFCLMLTSRGPKYRSEESAERVVQASAKRAIGELYHDNCRCYSKAAYSEDEPWAGDSLAYRIEWTKYTEGYDRKAALLRWRRYIEGRNLSTGVSNRPRTSTAESSRGKTPSDSASDSQGDAGSNPATAT